MGRLLGFLIIIVVALAGVWFFMPGGKDMLLDAKSKVMGAIPSKEEATEAVEDAGDAVEEAAEETVEVVEEAAEAATEEAPQ
jgi:hypothetical protein